MKLAPLECLPVDTAVQITRVYLACAHLKHDPGNNEPANLKALCKRCHMLHDRDEHWRQRWFTYRRRKAAGDLFSGHPRATLLRNRPHGFGRRHPRRNLPLRLGVMVIHFRPPP